MPSILNLKFKGNKSFVAFSNLNDTESLTKTWKVCTKVASYLEQGQRLENLSWRLWHLQNLMVDTDNAKSKREFKKLSKCMGDKLDKEKGRSIEELEAPDFKRNHSSDMIRQRAVEKERNREASHNAQPGTIKRMQFTFSVDQQAHQTPSTAPAKRPDTRPSAEFNKRTRAAAARAQMTNEDTIMTDADTTPSSSTSANCSSSLSTQFLHFPPLFSTGFGPSALLHAAPTLTNTMNYGEGFDPSRANDSFSISRPTIELPLDEILFGEESTSWLPMQSDSVPSNTTSNNNASNASNSNNNSYHNGNDSYNNKRKNTNTHSAAGQQDVVMESVPAPATTAPLVISLSKKNSSHSSSLNKSNIAIPSSSSSSTSSDEEEEEEEEYIPPSAQAPSSSRRNSVYKNIPPLSQTVKEVLPETVTPTRLTSSIYGTRSNTPTSRPHLTVRTQGTVTTRSSGPGATATSLNPAVLRGGGSGSSSSGSSLGHSTPGGAKAECSNCGATHTPLWRRGLNDELNCNACGLYCKLHKRPRPKSMRNSHGEGRAQVVPRQETVDVIGPSTLAAQCYNCHTTATPLWRKDDEGKTVCNACGLYYKLHGSARPISMKSDVIRKRSRHDARRASITGPEDTPSDSPSASPLASPARVASPTLAPDSTTQLSYDFEDDSFRAISAPSGSELMGALGALTGTGVVNHVGDTTHGGLYQTPSSPFNHSHTLSSALTASSSSISLYPGPYHPDYLLQFSNVPGDALPFSSVDSVEMDAGMSPRSNKRRRMSTDSAEDPPPSAVSFASYTTTGDGGYNSTASSTSHSHSHSLSHPMSRGHSHSFSLSHTHSHSLSSHVHSHSLSHAHGHAKRSSMEFPFTTYNANGTINSGPVLRGSGNTFWHPPMLPQTGSDNENHLFHPHGSNNSNNNNNGGNESGGGRSAGRGNNNNEDSAMDYLHPPQMLQDEDNLFSTYVHPPMALPEEAVQSAGDGNDGNMHTPMYVDSSYYH